MLNGNVRKCCIPARQGEDNVLYFCLFRVHGNAFLLTFIVYLSHVTVGVSLFLGVKNVKVSSVVLHCAGWAMKQGNLFFK